jgi:hypothetical protein
MAHTIRVEVPQRDLGKLDAVVEIRNENGLIGTLNISKGGVDYWPKGVKTNVITKTWVQFDKLFTGK